MSNNSDKTHNKMYCLSWNSYKSNICNGFAQLQQKEEFVDMTLVAEGHLVKVHKNIISLASPYIKNVIKSVPCTHPIIFLANMTHDVLCQILEYIYTGEVCVEAEKLNDFTRAAKDLQLPGIANDLSHATLSKGSSDNVIAPESLPIEEKNNRQIKNRKYGLTDVVSSNIDDILQLNIQQLNDVNNHDMPLVQSLSTNTKNVPEGLDSLNVNKRQILENRQLQCGQSDEDVARIKKQSHVTIDFEMALSENASSNYQSLINASEAVSGSADIPLQEARLLDYETNKVKGTSVMNDKIRTNITLLQNNENNDYDYSVNVTRMDVADNFDEFLKFPDPPTVTIKEDRVTNQQIQQSNIIDSINTEEQPQFSFTLSNDILPQQYTVSNRGSLQMILNRYVYSMQFSANRGVKRRWRCIDYRILRCGAYIDTVNDRITKRKNCHTHPYHDKKILKKIQANLIFGTLNTALEETRKINMGESEKN